MIDQPVSELYKSAVSSLNKHYELREANLILQYVFEDLWNIKSPQKSQLVFSHKQYVVFQECLSQLMNHVPWQYIVGQADFYGLKFKVNRSVLIPRPETEEMVHLLIEHIQFKALRIWDIGTGSGCIAVSLAKNLPNTETQRSRISQQSLNKLYETNENYIQIINSYLSSSEALTCLQTLDHDRNLSLDQKTIQKIRQEEDLSIDLISQTLLEALQNLAKARRSI